MNSRNTTVPNESERNIAVRKIIEKITRKRNFLDAESITENEPIYPNQSINAIETKRFKAAYSSEKEPDKHIFLSNSANLKLCNRVKILPNVHGDDKDYSFVRTRKRGSDVSDEQCSLNKKVKLQELDDEVIVKKQKNTNKLTFTKNLVENTVQKSKKPEVLTALLMNGSLSSVVNIDEQKYRIYNTCAFDSVATVISRAFLDNSTYVNFVNANSNSEFLNFCKAVAFRDDADNLNRERVKILRRLFNEDNRVSNLKVINCECNVMKIIYDLLKECPSSKDHIRCSNDGCENANKCRNSSTIILDETKLKHLENLEEMVNEYTKQRIYNCGLCTEQISAKRVLSYHLFIETDQVKSTSKFAMSDIPQEIRVGKYKYVLNGSVNYESGHYTSHVRRLNENVWETHNDLKSHIKICTIPEILIVEPHLLVYTRK